MSDFGFFPPTEPFLQRSEKYDEQKTLSFSEPLRRRSYNLVKKGLVTSVRNQLPCNSCSAFGITASLETRHLLETGKKIELGAGWIHKCIFDASCKRALNMSDLIEELDGRQIPLASQGNYPWSAQHCETSGRIECNNFEQFYGDQQIMNAVSQGVAVAVGMKLNHNFKSWSGDEIYSLDDSGDTFDHVAVIVGYDTDIDLWLIKNSMGDTWGDSGFFRVKFGDCGIAREFLAFGAVTSEFEIGTGTGVPMV